MKTKRDEFGMNDSIWDFPMYRCLVSALGVEVVLLIPLLLLIYWPR